MTGHLSARDLHHCFDARGLRAHDLVDQLAQDKRRLFILDANTLVMHSWYIFAVHLDCWYDLLFPRGNA